MMPATTTPGWAMTSRCDALGFLTPSSPLCLPGLPASLACQSFNPAEFALDLVSIDYTNAETEADSRLRLGQLLASWRARRGPALLDGMRKRRPTLRSGGSTAMVVSHEGGEPVKRRSLRMRLRARARRFSEQFRLLFRRSWRYEEENMGSGEDDRCVVL